MRLIIALDGSASGSSPSNVRRFCSALSHSSEQYCFYKSLQDLDSEEDHICNGYTYIMDNYRPGDELFIMGFSRGAFAARVLANFVARLGVLLRRDEAFKKAFKAYRDGKLDDFQVTKINPDQPCELAQSRVPRAYQVEIEVVGCWDTVATMGVPLCPVMNAGGVSEDYKYLDASLVKGIKHAFHALALDECRVPFTPTLWCLPGNPEDANVGSQVPTIMWVVDTATDLSLAWIIDQCLPFLNFDLDYLIAREGYMEPEDDDEKGRFDTEYQGWGRGMCYDSYREGRVCTPGGYGGQTNEMMHASVRERWETSRQNGYGLTTGPAVWSPKALEGFMPTQMEGGQEWEWVNNGMMGTAVTIPEAPFPTTDGFESRLRYAAKVFPKE